MSVEPVTTRDYEAHPRSEQLQLTKTEIERDEIEG